VDQIGNAASEEDARSYLGFNGSRARLGAGDEERQRLPVARDVDKNAVAGIAPGGSLGDGQCP
jgi:hypothetical protein